MMEKPVFDFVIYGRDFDLMCTHGDDFHKGYGILCRGNKYYIHHPKHELNEGIEIAKLHFIQRLYNFWDYPDKADMKKVKINEYGTIATVNPNFLRTIYLDCYLNSKVRKIHPIGE